MKPCSAGLDWASRNHALCIIDSTGAVVEQFEVAHDAAGLRELLTRLPDISPAGPAEWLASNFISGPKHLPVQFTPARHATA